MMHFSFLVSLVIVTASLIVPALSKLFNPFSSDNRFHPHLPLPITVIHQFPVGTWVESLAIRNNGKILTTALSSPDIVQVDNRGKKPNRLVHTFANATACTGIVHLGKDTFYVIAGNFTLSILTPVPGSWSVYRIDVSRHHPHHTEPKPAQVSWVANFPDAVFLKGITILDKQQEAFLLSDSGAGVVYRLDGKTGQVLQVIDDRLMKPSSSASFGVGISGIGIQKHTHSLYFTNRNQGLIAHIRINKDGTAKGSASVVAHLEDPDEFAITDANDVVVAQNGVDSMGRVSDDADDANDSIVNLAGGPPNGTAPTLFGPTGVRFGKVMPIIRGSRADWMLAYISTNGGTAQYLDGNVTRGGTISAVDMRGWW